MRFLQRHRSLPFITCYVTCSDEITISQVPAEMSTLSLLHFEICVSIIFLFLRFVNFPKLNIAYVRKSQSHYTFFYYLCIFRMTFFLMLHSCYNVIERLTLYMVSTILSVVRKLSYAQIFCSETCFSRIRREVIFGRKKGERVI